MINYDFFTFLSKPALSSHHLISWNTFFSVFVGALLTFLYQLWFNFFQIRNKSKNSALLIRGTLTVQNNDLTSLEDNFSKIYFDKNGKLRKCQKIGFIPVEGSVNPELLANLFHFRKFSTYAKFDPLYQQLLRIEKYIEPFLP